MERRTTRTAADGVNEHIHREIDGSPAFENAGNLLPGPSTGRKRPARGDSMSGASGNTRIRRESGVMELETRPLSPDDLIHSMLRRFWEDNQATQQPTSASHVSVDPHRVSGDSTHQQPNEDNGSAVRLGGEQISRWQPPTFTLELVHTWSIQRQMLPGTAIFLGSSFAEETEVLLTDMSQRSKIELCQAKRGSPLACKGYLEPFQRLSSVVKCNGDSNVIMTDQLGVYFINSTTKETLKFLPAPNLWAAQQLFDKVVCIRDEGPKLSIVTLDPQKREILGQLMLDRNISEARKSFFQEIKQGDQPDNSGKGYTKNPSLRFMAVDTEGSEDLRFALVDWGLDRIFIVGMAGEPLGVIGGHGKLPGQFMDPAGAVFLPDGRLLAADSRNHRLQLFHAQDFGVIWSGPLPGNIRRPTGISLEKGENGSLFLIVSHLNPPGVSLFRIYGV